VSEISFFVAGEPAPKGSTKSFPYHKKGGGLGVSTTNANPRTKDWELRVAYAAQQVQDGRPLMTGPVAVSLMFALSRPKSLPKRETEPIKKKNDLDKLVRALLDGLTGTIFEDDGQVIVITATKSFARPDNPPGCSIVLKEVVP
jgi:Holliday junction resolvase RusA-like endonuclease